MEALMANLIFSMNATLPIFFVMMLGYFLRHIGLIDESFALKMNSFVFKIALPVNLFVQLYSVDFYQMWDSTFVLFCFVATLLAVGLAWFASHLLRDHRIRGEFVQGTYRSSASLLGMAYIENIYGQASIGSMMMIGCVPLYNICAVIVLSLMNPENPRMDKKLLKKTLLGIIRNPIIIGIFLGFAWALLEIPLLPMFAKTLSLVGQLSTPMGILSMGALLDFGKIKEKLGPTVFASLLKLLGLVALFLPLAIRFGFREEKLIAILIMLGSATTVSSFTMAKNMGHEGSLSSGIVMLTTLGSSVTLTFWIYLLRSMGLVEGYFLFFRRQTVSKFGVETNMSTQVIRTGSYPASIMAGKSLARDVGLQEM